MTTWTNRDKPVDGLATEDDMLLITEDGLSLVIYDFMTDWVVRAKTIVTNWTNRVKP